MNPTHALWILIVGSAVVRLICSACLGLGNDEAYHSLYAAHPALSYFDHPPMMSWIEMMGLALPGAGRSTWALRIGFILLFAGSTAILARLTTRYYGPRAGFLAAFALNVTGYYGLAASMFALPDGPLLFFWLLTIDRLSAALDDPDPRSLRPWVEVGLAWGGALLSKYHAVFIPMGAALPLARPPDAAAMVVPTGPLPGIGHRVGALQPGPDLECPAWMGLLLLPGGTCGRGLDAEAGLSGRRDPGTGGVSVPVDLGASGRAPGAGMAGMADDRPGFGTPLALPGCVPVGTVHGGGLLPAGLASLGPDRDGFVVSDPRSGLGHTIRAIRARCRMAATRGLCGPFGPADRVDGRGVSHRVVPARPGESTRMA